MPSRTTRIHRVSSVPRSQRRKLVWATFKTSNATTASGTSSANQDLLGNLEVAGVGIFGGTIMRTHCSLYVGAAAADTNPGVTIGFIVHDKNDTANDPHTDDGADWMLHRVVAPGIPGPAVAATAMNYGMDLDIKAKRRLHEVGDAYHFRLYNGGSATATWTLFVKTLIALP